MDTQMTLTVILVSLSFLYVLKRAWLTWRGENASCHSGCRCPNSGKQQALPDISQTWIPVEEITLRQSR